MSSTRPYREIATVIAESIVIIAAADRKIHTEEKKLLVTTLKSVWISGYGPIKAALLVAFREVKLAQDFDMDLKVRLKKHALLMSKIFSDREKNSFLTNVEYMMRVDGEVAREEYDMFMILKNNLNPPAGFLGSLKTALSVFSKS